MQASLIRARRRCFLRTSKNAAASSKGGFFPIDGQTRREARQRNMLSKQPTYFFFSPFFEIVCWCIRDARKLEILFVVLFLPRFTKTRMSMQVAYDQTGPAAEVREHANSSLSANRSGSKGRKKERKIWRGLLGHQSRPLRGADQTAR